MICAALVFTVTVGIVVGSQGGTDSKGPPRNGGSPGPPVAGAASDPADTDEGGEVSWTSSHGVSLPVSVRHGPQRAHGGSVSGFARTRPGAAIAAAHLVVMTSPTVGPTVFGPTIARQVVGPNAHVMATGVAQQYQALRLAAGVEEGRPLPGADADVMGFVLDAYDGEHAVVRLILTSPDLRTGGRVVELLATLAWAEGDWKLVAPPNGVWDSLARVAAAPPEGLQRFEEVA